MKAQFLIPLAVFLLCVGCFPGASDGWKADQVVQPAAPPAVAAGIVPADNPLFRIASFPSEHDWHDVDRFYKEELPRYASTDYYSSLRHMALIHLVNPFQFQQHADRKTLEYYFGEMQQVDFMDWQAFTAVAAALFLKGWSREQIQKAAMDRYERNMAFIQSATGSEKTLESLKESQEELLRFANNFPNRWGSY